MLNARHKSVLFLTLVATGGALLAGATLGQGLGLLILGCAFAWLLGSEPVLRSWTKILTLLGKLKSWLRLPFLLALIGGLFAAVATWSNMNTFLAVGLTALCGAMLASQELVATKNRVGRVVSWIAGCVTFFFGSFLVSMLVDLPTESAGRLGALTAYGFVGFLFGRFWIAKGWTLVVSSISPPASQEPSPGLSSAGRPIGLYLSVFFGLLFLAGCLGLFAFLSFSEQIAPHTKQTKSEQSILSVVLFMMLLTWWPYAAWRGIVRREQNPSPATLRWRKRVLVLAAALPVALVSAGVTFGIQNGFDRQMTQRIEESGKGFSEVASKIGAIKGRNLETADDYIAAYTEIAPLLEVVEGNLSALRRILAEASVRDKQRGPINIQLLYPRRNEQNAWNSTALALLQEDIVITRKQVEVVRLMAGLTDEDDRIDFWNKAFKPLADQEDMLRQQLAVAMKSDPQADKRQAASGD